ncbi:MAG: short-chain dehydrogenase [Paenibacillaceae bacterium]|jgi:short-subunit dehydrogenase|nr:short-chain dehydrogenase [Paenibacillaceae bacterium]
MKTMVIVGAGKRLGMSLARQFGKKGFQIALVARNEEKLLFMKSQLLHEGIEASYYPADIYDSNQLSKAFRNIYERYGNIDILEFSPTAGHHQPIPVLDLKPGDAEDAIIGNVFAAIHCVNEVLPSMLKNKAGALLFTTGLSAIYPNPQMADSSIAKAGLRSYIANLESELTPKNIFVGHISLGIFLKSDSKGISNPDNVARVWYEKYVNNQYGEELYPEGVTPETVIR